MVHEPRYSSRPRRGKTFERILTFDESMIFHPTIHLAEDVHLWVPRETNTEVSSQVPPHSALFVSGTAVLEVLGCVYLR